MKKLNIRDVAHLAHRLKSNPRELERITRNKHRYYRSRPEPKSSGNGVRELNIPEKRLKVLLKNLNDILQKLDLPNFLQGGIRGRSNISNAKLHKNASTVLNLDITDFFPSVTKNMIYMVFRDSLGCSSEVATLIAELSTYKNRLPQGSPASSMIANVVLLKAGKRLEGLATAHDSEYGQYIDDCTLSGPAYLEKMKSLAVRILQEEGFASNPDKLLVRHRDAEQVVTGVRLDGGVCLTTKHKQGIDEDFERIEHDLSATGEVSITDINSLKGKIGYARQLSRGTAKQMTRRLKRILK